MPARLNGKFFAFQDGYRFLIRFITKSMFRQHCYTEAAYRSLLNCLIAAKLQLAYASISPLFHVAIALGLCILFGVITADTILFSECFIFF